MTFPYPMEAIRRTLSRNPVRIVCWDDGDEVVFIGADGDLVSRADPDAMNESQDTTTDGTRIRIWRAPSSMLETVIVPFAVATYGLDVYRVRRLTPEVTP